jgi:hypothetical protein
MRTKKVVIGWFILLLLIANAFSGPFGLEMGMTRTQIEILIGKNMEKTDQPYSYKIIPPSTYSNFSNYNICISPTYGLYYIMAISNPIKTSSYGEQLKKEFSNVENSLKTIYGKNSFISKFDKPSIFTNSEYWMNALQNEEIIHASLWERDIGSILPDDIMSIGLKALAFEQPMIPKKDTIGYLKIEYYSKNTEVAEREIKDRIDSEF